MTALLTAPPPVPDPEPLPRPRRLGPRAVLRLGGPETSGLAVYAAKPDLLDALHGSVHSGRFIDAVTERFPTVVLGAEAATRLGINAVLPGEPRMVWIGGQWFTVIGILDKMPL